MCTGAEMLLIGATAIQATGAIQRGNEEKKFGEFQAQQAEADAKAEREAGQLRADKIRKAGKSQQSEARASYAASSIDVSRGSPEVIADEIEESAESDALNEILYGNRKGARLEQDAAVSRKAGGMAQMAGRRAAFGSVLSSGSEISKGWKTKKPENLNMSSYGPGIA